MGVVGFIIESEKNHWRLRAQPPDPQGKDGLTIANGWCIQLETLVLPTARVQVSRISTGVDHGDTIIRVQGSAPLTTSERPPFKPKDVTFSDQVISNEIRTATAPGFQVQYGGKQRIAFGPKTDLKKY